MVKETHARRAGDTDTRIVDVTKLVAATAANRKRAYEELSALVRGEGKPGAAKGPGASRFKITPSHGAVLKATPNKREDKP